ncbi:lysophospholipid acyltransferase family protein [uncultured Fibrobacter sp.]|uniref:lysophospholipid acyltransferase family protein n=1 Tax=uncultured Fibrobacter sp. TaxID=261512 RepID=UPI0026091073|nr:lysophospholipid acyltransferase family protein [uncultured Fibrobacter sp.]
MRCIHKTVSRICAKVFAQAGTHLLTLSGWKRSTVESNLIHVYGTGKMSADKRAAFYRQVIENLTRHAGEILFRFDEYKSLPQKLESYPCRRGRNLYEIASGSAATIQKMRQGGIFLTAHYGNYEAMGPWLCRLGIPLKASHIPLKPSCLNRFVEDKLRSVDGKSYAVNPKNPREFLRILDDGNLFCLLADQDSRVPSATTGYFLGQNARMNPLPDFLLKHRPDTPVFACWIEEFHNMKVLHADELLAEGDGKIMEAFNRWLEMRIREQPELWYGWTHRRFYSVSPDRYK